MEDVTIKQKDTILGGVLDEYDVNCLRYVIDKELENTFDTRDDEEYKESLLKADNFLKDVIIKSKTAGR